MKTKNFLINGDCIEELKNLPDKSVDFFYLDLPYGETNCKWDKIIDMEQLWKELWRLSRHKRVAYVFSCSTKFGYTLIKSWEKGFKMDLVWKKRNKTGGIYSRYRPMKNHEMVYFFYRKSPKYNRDKYHKRIKHKAEVFNPASVIETDKDKLTIYGKEKKKVGKQNPSYKNWYEPPNPASYIDIYGETKTKGKNRRKNDGVPFGKNAFTPPNPASVIETKDKKMIYIPEKKCWVNQFGNYFVKSDKTTNGWKEIDVETGGSAQKFGTNSFNPPNPASIFASKKVFIGKRFHQTQKPLDLMEFLLKYWTDEGDVVLDPTMGSGSMGVMCKKMNRKFIGIEKDPEIFKVAQKRIEGEKLLKKKTKVLEL